eukprot:scaffold1989_cov63-Skeletonema_marinoi.AAC.3
MQYTSRCRRRIFSDSADNTDGWVDKAETSVCVCMMRLVSVDVAILIFYSNSTVGEADKIRSIV